MQVLELRSPCRWSWAGRAKPGWAGRAKPGSAHSLGCFSNLLVSEMLDSPNPVLVSEHSLSEETVPLG